MSQRAFLGFLGVAATAVGAFAIHALSSVEPGEAVVDLPAHVTRLAFGVDSWPEPREPGCFEELVLEPVPEPVARRRVYVDDLTFLGEGDWALGATLVRRRSDELSACYADEEVSDQRLEIALQGWGRPTVSGAGERSDCIADTVASWPWPQDLVGRVSISVRTGWLI
jgi:hypothetical protein